MMGWLNHDQGSFSTPLSIEMMAERTCSVKENSATDGPVRGSTTSFAITSVVKTIWSPALPVRLRASSQRRTCRTASATMSKETF